jgi:ABC-type phosphate transport system auxiliary subunit
MNIRIALQVAGVLEDEGVVSTVALALRTLAKEYQVVKAELDALEYERTRHIPALLKEGFVERRMHRKD